MLHLERLNFNLRFKNCEFVGGCLCVFLSKNEKHNSNPFRSSSSSFKFVPTVPPFELAVLFVSSFLLF